MRKRADWRLLPILCLTVGLQYSDKSAVGQMRALAPAGPHADVLVSQLSIAALFGVIQDLHLYSDDNGTFDTFARLLLFLCCCGAEVAAWNRRLIACPLRAERCPPRRSTAKLLPSSSSVSLKPSSSSSRADPTSPTSQGYIVGALPLSILAQRLSFRVACSLYILLWGICVILTPACTSFEGLMAQVRRPRLPGKTGS